MKQIFVRTAATLLFLPNSLLAHGADFLLLKPDVIESRLNSLSRDNAAREAALKRPFLESGCADHISEVPVKHMKLANLICVLPGQTEKVIIVGTHLDHVRAGDGAVDNWSGSSLLPSLYWSIKATPPSHTFVFVASPAEEQGLVGSHFYVTQMSAEDVARTGAMINLDSLGLGPTEAWVSHADPYLAGLLGWTAKALNLPISRRCRGRRLGGLRRIPKPQIASLTVHSITP